MLCDAGGLKSFPQLRSSVSLISWFVDLVYIGPSEVGSVSGQKTY